MELINYEILNEEKSFWISIELDKHYSELEINEFFEEKLKDFHKLNIMPGVYFSEVNGKMVNDLNTISIHGIKDKIELNKILKLLELD